MFESVEKEWMEALGYNDDSESDTEFICDADTVESSDSDDSSFVEEEDDIFCNPTYQIRNEIESGRFTRHPSNNITSTLNSSSSPDYEHLKKRENINTETSTRVLSL